MKARFCHLFLALDTYSRIGGMQRFNQRIIDGLGDHVAAHGISGQRVHIMRDEQRHIPSQAGDGVVAFGPSRAKFILSTLRAARHADTVLLGHINLLPVGWLLKRVYPSLKLAMFVHGVEVWNNPTFRKKRFFEPTALDAVTKIISVSKYTLHQMATQFNVPHSRFVVLPNAVDGPVSVGRAGLSERRLLSVARMDQHDRSKHLDVILQAFAALPPDLQDAHLNIVGDGPLRPELEELASSLNIRPRVHFLGRVQDGELARRYAEARAFVLPSSKEGFGIVYLEAWKHGIPVICGNEGAPPEIVSHGQDGFIVDPRQVAALTGHMSTLLQNRGLATEMGQRGAQKVLNYYLDAAFRRNLHSILHELLQ